MLDTFSVQQPIRFRATLRNDYTAPRHVATVRQLPSSPAGEDWFDWEVRPGPDPSTNASGPTDGFLVQVCYVEKTPAGICAGSSVGHYQREEPLALGVKANGVLNLRVRY